MMDRRDFMIGSLGTLAASSAAGAAAQAADSGGTDVVATGGSSNTPSLRARYAFSVSIFFKERILIDTARGNRAYVPCMGGEIWGPRLQGRVVPYSGADYGAGILIAHYALEASDGALIYIINHASIQRLGEDGRQLPWRQAPPTVIRPAGEPPQQSFSGGNPGDSRLQRFRTAPIFDAPVGRHDWMNRTVFVGHGVRHVNPDHSIFTYYELI